MCVCKGDKKDQAMADVKERLKACEDALKERGVLDVKFFFGSSLHEKPLSDLASDVANALELVARGNLKDLPPLRY